MARRCTFSVSVLPVAGRFTFSTIVVPASPRRCSDTYAVVFPSIDKPFGDFAAFLTMGGVTGFGVGFAVSVVDALLGERASSAQLASVLGRGAAKFLVAALPVYAMTRIGGI